VALWIHVAKKSERVASYVRADLELLGSRNIGGIFGADSSFMMRRGRAGQMMGELGSWYGLRVAVIRWWDRGKVLVSAGWDWLALVVDLSVGSFSFSDILLEIPYQVADAPWGRRVVCWKKGSLTSAYSSTLSEFGDLQFAEACFVGNIVVS
jgi:hypothetical protein